MGMPYLEGSKAKDDNADDPVGSVLDSGRLAAKLEASSPACNSGDVAGGLAKGMKVKPRWVGRGEYFKVPSEYSTNWQ